MKNWLTCVYKSAMDFDTGDQYVGGALCRSRFIGSPTATQLHPFGESGKTSAERE
jgi:hypothetical protein